MSLGPPEIVSLAFFSPVMLITFSPPLPVMVCVPVRLPKVWVGFKPRADAWAESAAASVNASAPTLDDTRRTIGGLLRLEKQVSPVAPQPDPAPLLSTPPVIWPLPPPADVTVVPAPTRTVPRMGPLFTLIEAVEPTEITEYWANVGPSPICATANEPARQTITKTVRPVIVARAERCKH